MSCSSETVQRTEHLRQAQAPGQESYSILFSEVGGFVLGSEEYTSNPLAMGETYTGDLYVTYEEIVENAMDYDEISISFEANLIPLD